MKAITAIPVSLILVAAAWAADPEETPQEAIVRLTSEFRKSQKLSGLTANDKLMKAAQDHADNLARQDKAGDDGRNAHILDGKTPHDRVVLSGYKSAADGENIGILRPSANPVPTAMNGWKLSPGHRKTMLFEPFTEMGVGLAKGAKSGRWYVVQVFGRPADADR
jgi:uncharacterized protein YkwD